MNALNPCLLFKQREKDIFPNFMILDDHFVKDDLLLDISI